MRLRFGRHAGHTTERLLLRAPDYAEWVMRRQPNGPVGRAFSDLARRLDAKPFTENCVLCGDRAESAGAYPDSVALILRCEPCRAKPDAAGLEPCSTFRQAVAHVAETCARAQTRNKRRIIRTLARAKGLERRITEAEAARFFL